MLSEECAGRVVTLSFSLPLLERMLVLKLGSHGECLDGIREGWIQIAVF